MARASEELWTVVGRRWDSAVEGEERGFRGGREVIERLIM